MFRATSALLILAILGGCGSAVPDARSTGARPTSQPRPVAVSPEAKLCLKELSGTGSRFSPLPDAYKAPGCSTLNTVSLASLRGDVADIGLANLGPVSCPTARNFSAWARFGVDRAARQILGSPLERIETMGSYSCRNVAGSPRRSAHSRAAAIDVGAFILRDGRRITVTAAWNAGDAREREFLRVVHRSACKRFGTVLGPDYNAAHRDHLHLEEGDGSFCR